MAETLLTPTHVYQYTNGYLSEIDPTWHQVGDTKDLVFEFTIPNNLLHIAVSDAVFDVGQPQNNNYVYAVWSLYQTRNTNYKIGSAFPTDIEYLCSEYEWGSDVDPVVFGSEEVPKNINGNKLYVAVREYPDHIPGWLDRYVNFDDGLYKNTKLKLTYTAVSSFTIKVNPANGFIDRTKAFKLTASVDPIDNILSQFTVSSGTIKYKLTSASSYSSISFSGTGGSIPANTLSANQTYNIYMTGTASTGQSATSPTGSYTTVDSAATVTPISPVNEVTYGTAVFKWNYSVPTGTTQYGFDLQISQNGSSWTTVANHVISAQSTFTHSISTAGTWFWRVRGYNQSNASGAWSSAVQFINIAPPVAPTITSVTSVNKPTVTWTSTGQMAYRVRFLKGTEVVEDSGQVYSSGTQYEAEEYLTDGVYTVEVAIINTYGRSSDWSSRSFTIASGLTPPEVTLTGNAVGITVSIETSDVYSRYYIKRNGVLIGVTTTGTYTDLFANGDVTYTVIAVTSDDRSTVQTRSISHSVPSFVLIARSGTVYKVNRRINQMVGVQSQRNAVYDMAEYIGASLPEHHFAKMREGRFTVSFKDYVRTENLLGEKLFYADMHGNGAWVAVVSVGRTESRFGNETTAELQITAVNEEIDYA